MLEKKIELLCGDSAFLLQLLPSGSVDAIVTDPPYGLSFMGKRWDYDVPSEEIWRECLRVLKPGGHLLAFAGTRTQHRMAVRIEDAGFEIRDMIAWVYGSGFPKSLDVSKAIDKAAGATPIDTGIPSARHNSHSRGSENSVGFQGGVPNITAPATEAARQWQGWGTALKPALEPITVARKPLAGTVAANVLEHGTGALNVDGCRVGDEQTVTQAKKGMYGAGSAEKMREQGYRPYHIDNRDQAKKTNPPGRWPANLIHSGEDDAIAGLGEAARYFYCAKASKRDRDEGLEGFEVIISSSQLNKELSWENEERLAVLRVVMETSRPRVIDASGVLSKSASEWNTLFSGSESMAPCHLPTTYTTETATSSTTESKILNCFLNLLTSENMEGASLGMVFGGSPAESVEHGIQQITITSAKTESALGVEPAVLRTQLKISVNAKRNNHVTVKPTDLMRYLCRLVTPPGGVVLDPFMGSGSTGKAAVLEGFQFIGIEREAEYLEIAKARIEHAGKANRE
jgi:hypothetical protein